MSAVYDSYMRKITNRNKEKKRSSSRHVQRYISVEKKLISRDKFYRIFAEFTYPANYGLQPKFLSQDDRFRENLLKTKKHDRAYIKEHLNFIFANPEHPFYNLVRQFVNLFHASYALSPEMLKQKGYDSANLSADRNFSQKIRRLLRCAVHDIKNFVMETKLLLKKKFPGMDTKAHDIICQTELHKHLFPLLDPSLLDLYLLNNRGQNIAFRLACVELSKTQTLTTLGVSEELRLIPPVQDGSTKGSVSDRMSLGSKGLEVVPELEKSCRPPDSLGWLEDSSKKILESNLNTLNSPSTSSPERGEVIAKQDFALSHKDACGQNCRLTLLDGCTPSRRFSTEIDIPPSSLPVTQQFDDRAKSQGGHSFLTPLRGGWSHQIRQLSRAFATEPTEEKKRKPPRCQRSKSLGFNKGTDMESLNTLSMDILGSLPPGFQEAKSQQLNPTPPNVKSSKSEELSIDDHDVQFQKEAVPDRRRIKTTSLLSASLKRTSEVLRARTPSVPQDLPYQEAIDCIKSIVTYQAPEDKIRVLSTAIDFFCCKAIDEFYERYPVDNAKQKRIGPDDLLSIFSYLLINTHCDTFISQLQFTDDFVADNVRCDVMGYYLATARAATNIVLKNYQQVVKIRQCKSI